MEQLKLPERLGSIEIPPYLDVTRIAAGAACLLHAVAPRAILPRTPRGPYAELGNVIHALIEIAIAGRLGNGGIPPNVAEAFDYLLEKAAARLSIDIETRPYANLSVAFSKREWEKRRFYAISDAEAVKSPHRPTTAETKESRSEPLSLARFLQGGRKASEVPFESASLRIRGRIDFVSVGDNEVTVSDFKSGKVFDRDGNLNEQTSRQLRLYALAILELAPKIKVALRVFSRGTESFERFDEQTKTEMFEWLRGITDVLRTGAQISAPELASIGPQCARCDVRPVCPAYLSAVFELWKQTDTPFELPLDTAGTVTDVREQGDGYFSVKIVDYAVRTVKIHRLTPDRVRGIAANQIIWFFDLASIETKMPAPAGVIHETSMKSPCFRRSARLGPCASFASEITPETCECGPLTPERIPQGN
jgi:hypothetical protein